MFGPRPWYHAPHFMSFSTVEIRPRRSMAFFAILSIFMVVASYVFVLLLAAACVYLPYVIVTSGDSPGGQIILLFLFGIVLAATMLWPPLPRPDKFTPPGLLLERAMQPRLFAELDNIAAAPNEPMPREVALIGDVNAEVADRGGFMGFGSRRVMGLGLPLLSILTVSQFRAVLAHEFAHYYGGDTRVGPWVYKTQTAIVRVFQNIGSVGKLARIAILGVMNLAVATLMKWYFVVFLRAIQLVSRRKEYRADELACLIAGRQPLIDGLRAIHGAAMAWPAYWKTELAPMLCDGAVPGIGEGFARFISLPAIKEPIQKGLDKEIREAKTNPYHTHPPLRDRIAATKKLPEVLIQEESRPARSLLDHPDNTELRLLESVNPDRKPGTRRCVSWDGVGTRATIPNWKKLAAEYSSILQGITAEPLPEQIPKRQQIGTSIRDPKGMVLTREQRTRRAGELLGVGLGLALARQRLDPEHGAGGIFSPESSASLNPFVIIDQLTSGQLSAQDWITQIRTLGLLQLSLGPRSVL